MTNGVLSPIQTSKKQVAALTTPIIAAMSKDTAGRYTESDAKALMNAMPAKGDNQQTAQMKRQQLANIFQPKMVAPTLTKWGIDPGSVGRYNNQGQSKFKFSPSK